MINLLTSVKKKMRKLKIPYQYAELSNRPDKKIKVVIDGQTIHFGDKNSTTYLEGASDEKRDAYRARASKIKNKDGQYTYLIKYTPNYLAYHVLW
jgi:hypothetical protein